MNINAKTTDSSPRITLPESDSKNLLAQYGIPVAPHAIAKTLADAIACAERFGYPLVLKGHGAKLAHKSERNLVRVNIKTQDELTRAFDEVTRSAGADGDGCLVQPYVEGRRELVAGLFRDDQFGPCVMFGLGGILTEALADTSFRIAPVDEHEALRMAREISARKLLDAFRGEPAVSTKDIACVLSGLSRIGLARQDIAEIDINPLIVTPKGDLVAVDALVVLAPEPKVTVDQASPADRAAIHQALDIMTNPKSIAVVGATRTQSQGFPGMYACIDAFGYPGELYPINPNADEILGRKAYPTLEAIGKPVDLVVMTLPAPYVPASLRDCVAAGCKNVHIFSSGFKETGEPDGIRLQQEIETIAREGGLYVIGPNCMGVYSPKAKLNTWINAPVKPGPVAFISQSGGNAQDYTSYAADRLGVYFSKVISYGNALNLDSSDFLEYLADDDDTQIITLYLEGVKDGRRFFEQVLRVNRTKPIILIKAGLTESGARAVASHTGSMAGSEKIWEALFRQTGAVRVENLEEMAEVACVFDKVNATAGRGVAVIGTGGGIGVAAADACARVGLNLTAFSEDLMTLLREFIPPAGNMIRNPIDAHLILIEPDLLGKTLDLLSSRPEIDHFVISLHMDWLHSSGQGEGARQIAEYIATEARRFTRGKPLVVSLRQFNPRPGVREALETVKMVLVNANVPVFGGIPRAVAALAKMVNYYEYQQDRK